MMRLSLKKFCQNQYLIIGDFELAIAVKLFTNTDMFIFIWIARKHE
ncbi:MAG: hypothetical protein CLLPBCKN_006094 [Chroococcidiopsis cubana SAG 39.79]|nr:hypothetical protein [Chroococcidiopsis cubana SAG 39.79]